MSSGNPAQKNGEALITAVRSLLMTTGRFQGQKLASAGNYWVIREIKSAANAAIRFGYAGAFAEEPHICTGIFGNKHCPDFLIYRPEWETPLALHCVSQDKPGSAYNKVAELMLTIQQNYPSGDLECPAAFLLCGKMIPDGVIRGARNFIRASNEKLRVVWDSSDTLRAWVLSGCPYPQRQSQTAFA